LEEKFDKDVVGYNRTDQNSDNSNYTHMTPVAFAACRQLLPPLYQQDTCIAYLTRAALMELKTVHEVIFIFFTVSEP
jgi:hypothetical protein